MHLIKAISVSGQDDIATYKAYEGLVDYFLFDTKCPTVGGSGRQFDWSVLSAYDGETPFLLSGGIGPNDAERVKAFHHPKCIGIDLNSRFEIAPGMKDVAALRKFLNELNR
jgi:phosphoribosylanthranilate isomerase